MISFLDTENVTLEENPEVVCENCDKKCLETTILWHISRTKKCKLYYSSRFDEMKKDIRNCNRRRIKRKSRDKIGTENELKRQREAWIECNNTSWLSLEHCNISHGWNNTKPA